MRFVYLYSIILLLIYLLILVKGKRIPVIHTLNNTSCNCLKGWLAIVIVMGHLSFRTNLDFMRLFSGAGMYAVGAFFFLSGYGLLTSLIKKRGGYFDDYLYKRWRKVIVPFLIAIVLYHIICYNYPWDYRSICYGDTYSFLPFCWYVIVALLFYLAFYLIFKYIKYDHFLYPVGLLTIITLSLYVSLKCVGWGEHWYISLFSFPLGMIYKLIEGRIIGKSSLYIICFVLVAIVCSRQVTLPVVILATMLPLTLVLFFSIINYTGPLSSYLGNISYEIYLLQGIPMYFLKSVVNISNEYIYVFVTLLTTIGLSVLMKTGIDRIQRIKVF